MIFMFGKIKMVKFNECIVGINLGFLLDKVVNVGDVKYIIIVKIIFKLFISCKVW